MSAAEYTEWRAFYEIDPWGDQRADLRAAQIAWVTLRPHVKTPQPLDSFLLYPDDAHDLPDDVTAQERSMMLALQRGAD